VLNLTPEELTAIQLSLRVAAVATLLASDAGAGITGSLISIDGGTAPY